jgi:hypothetical protein
MFWRASRRRKRRLRVVKLTDLTRSERSAVDAELINLAVLKPAVAQALTEREVAVAECCGEGAFVKLVAQRFSRKRLAVHIHLQAGGTAGAVVRDRDMLPLALGDRLKRAHADAVARPDAIDAEDELAVLQQQVEPVEADVGAEAPLSNHGG